MRFVGIPVAISHLINNLILPLADLHSWVRKVEIQGFNGKNYCGPCGDHDNESKSSKRSRARDEKAHFLG